MALIAIPAAVAGNKPGNSLNAKSCQKNGWQSLITSTGLSFSSETACTSYAAGGGTLLPKAAQPCFNGGWQTLIRSDGTTFANQAACVTYASASGNVLHPLSQARCLEAGWQLWNTATHDAVAPNTQTCFDLLAANNLTGGKLNRSLDAATNVVSWSFSAFGVPADAGSNPVCSFGQPLTFLIDDETTYQVDPWFGGVACITASGPPIGADGLYSETGSRACPIGPVSVDDFSNPKDWFRRFQIVGYSGWFTVSPLTAPACPPLRTIVETAPVAVDDSITVNAGSNEIEANLLFNDTDAEGNQLRVDPNSVSQPAHGTVDVETDFSGTVSVSYTPDDSSVTSDSFTYKVQDRGATSANPATVHITINRP